jgi:nitrate reductase gamma subunit
VFLLLLCNDREVLGPWVNGGKTNAFTSAVIAVLITLSVVLTASVLFPAITARQMVMIFVACAGVSAVAGVWTLARRRRTASAAPVYANPGTWRMPPLSLLAAPVVSGARKLGLTALRGYLAIAMILVIVKIVEVAISAH